MRAFVNTKVTKEEVLASLAEHRKADRLIKGSYWRNGRGCAVGCTIHDFYPGAENNHTMYESLFGIPRDLAYLEDQIFESLSSKTSQEWPERFITAVPVGADLMFMACRFVHWLLSNNDSPMAKWRDEPRVIAVRELYERELAGDSPTEEEWVAVKNTTRNVACDAVNNAALIAAWGIIYDTAWTAAGNAARAAADAIANAAANHDTRVATNAITYKTMADKLIEFIKQAPR